MSAEVLIEGHPGSTRLARVGVALEGSGAAAFYGGGFLGSVAVAGAGLVSFAAGYGLMRLDDRRMDSAAGTDVQQGTISDDSNTESPQP